MCYGTQTQDGVSYTHNRMVGGHTHTTGWYGVAMVSRMVWGGYGQKDRSNYRSLLQNSVSFIGLFGKRDL